jgi:sarcosine oxidase
MHHYDTIVVGGGIAGCAATYHLAKDRQRVLLIEQYGIGHTNGSSHGQSRIIRYAYNLPEYVQLMRAAYPLWHALEAESGEQLLTVTGGLDFGDSASLTLQATRTALTEHGLAFDDLDRAALARRFPQFNLPDSAVGLYQPEAGILNADLCVATLAKQARHHGAFIREHETVQQIVPDGAGVLVRTTAGDVRADRLILTAGSWIGTLTRQLGVELPLRVVKEQVAYFTPNDPALYQIGQFPVFIHHGNTDLSFAGYGFPIYGMPGIKVAFHGNGPEVAPDDDDRSIDDSYLDQLRTYVTDLFPGVRGDAFYAISCRYTMTPDEHFIIDQLPGHPQIIIASPCSGHGFKFGTLTGRILADLAQHNRTKHAIDLFRLARFAGS